MGGCDLGVRTPGKAQVPPVFCSCKESSEGGRGIFFMVQINSKKRVHHRVAALRPTFDVDILFNTLFLESRLKRGRELMLFFSVSSGAV